MKIRLGTFDWLFLVVAMTMLGLILFTLQGCGGSPRVGANVKPPPSGGSDVNAMLVWLSTISILGIGASIAAAVFLPVKRLAVAGIAGFGAILACALLVKAALPFLPWVAAGLVVLGIAAAIVCFRRYVLATQAAVGFGVAMTQANTDEEAQAIKHRHAILQQSAGVKNIIDNVLGKLKQ